MRIHGVVQRHGRVHSVHDPHCVDPLPTWLFDPEALAARGLICGSSDGRRAAWFLRLDGQALVLRHYWRGGIVARFTPDVYVWTGVARTRSFREWHLLATLRERDLPVPAPVAARASRHCAGYRADLITLAIPDARPLDACIRTGDADAALWQRVGTVIGRCHAAGAWHADLNVRNILVDTGGTPWLIDWDRGRLRATGRKWQQANLQRLRRSLAKAADLDAAAHTNWSNLLAGYDAAPSARMR